MNTSLAALTHSDPSCDQRGTEIMPSLMVEIIEEFTRVIRSRVDKITVRHSLRERRAMIRTGSHLTETE